MTKVNFKNGTANSSGNVIAPALLGVLLTSCAHAQPEIPPQDLTVTSEETAPPPVHHVEYTGMCGDYDFDIVLSQIKVHPTTWRTKSKIDRLEIRLSGERIPFDAERLSLDTSEKVVAVLPRCKETSQFFEIAFLVKTTTRQTFGHVYSASIISISFDESEEFLVQRYEDDRFSSVSDLLTYLD